MYGIYEALALHRNVPVDFIDEEGLLEPHALSAHRLIFVTEPDLPAARRRCGTAR